ncbi:hypothetical protein NAP1_10233 [Erythrobacter sp. NAP1]|uniref:hypothetical protein n=1 Tax=Erythrobacter sp. NAP1 TaxID=237727 RepID=UPI000068789E|nr:hypothetical protein [Erythrobacter sp. NAP1]EAQ27964.1 hypothetical protein NAP1_10233 [Erythrobacter sp. NAP1]
MIEQGDREELDLDDDIVGEIEIDFANDEIERGAIGQLKERCDAADIEVREREFEDGEKLLSILLPRGRNTRAVPASGGRADKLLEIKFEKYVFLEGFDAVCCYNEQTIEALVRGYPIPAALNRFIELASQEDDKSSAIVLEGDAPSGAPVASLGRVSNDLAVLLGARYLSRSISLKIQGGGFTNQEEARALLRKLADSIGFQMDLQYGTGFSLIQERNRRFISRRRRPDRDAKIKFPTHEYEAAPMSLYWYARDARGLPLLRFLGLYQCIEYFFPTYSESEAKRRLGLILKDPSFRTDRDSDLARLLTAMKLSRNGFGDERSQLRAVFDACIDPDELREFIASTSGLQDHLSSKSKKMNIHKVPTANTNLDLRNDVATRIYDIRCKIVHTKDDDHPDGRGMILPFSEEAETLEFDNLLLEFLAQKVLISSSVPIRFSV